MRVIKFKNVGSVIEYPFEGIGAFRNTEIIGDDIVGEYTGSASEEELPSYAGEWPIKAVEPLANLSKSRFVKMLGVDVVFELRQAQGTDKILTYLLEIFDAAGEVNLSDPEIKAMLETLEQHPSVPSFNSEKLAELT